MAKSFLECLAEQEHGKVRAKSFLECLAKYNHNHDARGRFASSNTGLHSGAAGDIIKLPDIVPPNSVGAKSIIGEVFLPNGDSGIIVEHIRNVSVFAGKGTKNRIREAPDLEAAYSAPANQWQKAKGIGSVEYDGEARLGEIHWYQAEGIGRVEYKLKQQPTGEWWLD